MRKKIGFLIPMILALLIYMAGLLMVVVSSWNLFYPGMAMLGVATLLILATAGIKMVTSRRRFALTVKFIIKLIVCIATFVAFTVGLGLVLTGAMIVLGVILCAAAILSAFWLIPMFIAFVRANPFEHIIITPNYDDVDTEFFRDPKNNEYPTEEKE